VKHPMSGNHCVVELVGMMMMMMRAHADDDH
jgi:hypothetical protein